MSIAMACDDFDDLRLSERFEWWDDRAECRLVVSQPDLDPQLWADYGRGALHSYRRHGVECALDRPALETGADTIMFFVALDRGGEMLGGVRAKGPLRSVDDSHALTEWQGQQGQDAVRKMIADRLPYGILEMKSAWLRDDSTHNGELTDAIARSGFHMMALLDVQFCMATAAAYVLNRWRSSGGVVAPIPATPYPDERYQTKMMWWDRRTFGERAERHQTAKILSEIQLIKAREARADSAAALIVGR